MKRILLLIGLITLLIGCVTTQEKPEPIPLIVNEYHEIDLLVGDLPRIPVTIPEYAYKYIQDRDKVSVVYLSNNIVMIYFDKEGPNLADPGHAAAIIFDSSEGYLPLLFQTTIKEEQRFFYYNRGLYAQKDVLPEPLMEISKPTYRKALQAIIDIDKSKISL